MSKKPSAMEKIRKSLHQELTLIELSDEEIELFFESVVVPSFDELKREVAPVFPEFYMRYLRHVRRVELGIVDKPTSSYFARLSFSFSEKLITFKSIYTYEIFTEDQEPFSRNIPLIFKDTPYLKLSAVKPEIWLNLFNKSFFSRKREMKRDITERAAGRRSIDKPLVDLGEL